MLNMSEQPAPQEDAASMARDPAYDEDLLQVLEAMKVSTGDAMDEFGDESYGSTKSVEHWPEPATS